MIIIFFVSGRCVAYWRYDFLVTARDILESHSSPLNRLLSAEIKFVILWQHIIITDKCHFKYSLTTWVIPVVHMPQWIIIVYYKYYMTHGWEAIHTS